MSNINVYSDLILRTDDAKQNLMAFDTQLMDTLKRWASQTVEINVGGNIGQLRKELDDLLKSASAANTVSTANRSGGASSPDGLPSRSTSAGALDINSKTIADSFSKEATRFTGDFNRAAVNHARLLESAMRISEHRQPGVPGQIAPSRAAQSSTAGPAQAQQGQPPEKPRDMRGLPEWARAEIDRSYKIAEKRGLTSRIEEMSAQRMTAKQVAENLVDTGKLEPDIAVGVVRATRAKMGIPSMDDTTEFEKWHSQYQRNRSDNAQSAESEPQHTQSLSEWIKGGTWPVRVRGEVSRMAYGDYYSPKTPSPILGDGPLRTKEKEKWESEEKAKQKVSETTAKDVGREMRDAGKEVARDIRQAIAPKDSKSEESPGELQAGNERRPKPSGTADDRSWTRTQLLSASGIGRSMALGLSVHALGQAAQMTTAFNDAGQMYSGQNASLNTRRTLAQRNALESGVSGMVPILGSALVNATHFGQAMANSAAGHGFVSDQHLLQKQADKEELQHSINTQRTLQPFQIAAIQTRDPRVKATQDYYAEIAKNDFEIKNNPLLYNAATKKYTEQGRQQDKLNSDLIDARGNENIQQAERDVQTMLSEAREQIGDSKHKGLIQFGAENGFLAARGAPRLAEIEQRRKNVETQENALKRTRDNTKEGSEQRNIADQKLTKFQSYKILLLDNINAEENIRQKDVIFSDARRRETAAVQGTGVQSATAFARFNAQARGEMVPLDRQLSIPGLTRGQISHIKNERESVVARQKDESKSLLAQQDRSNAEKTLAARITEEANTRGRYVAQVDSLNGTYALEMDKLNAAIKAMGENIDESKLSTEARNNLDEQRKRLQTEQSNLTRQHQADVGAQKITRDIQLQAIDNRNAVMRSRVYGSDYDATRQNLRGQLAETIKHAQGDQGLISRARESFGLGSTLASRDRRFEMEDLRRERGYSELRMRGMPLAAEVRQTGDDWVRRVQESGLDREKRTEVAKSGEQAIRERMLNIGPVQQIHGGAENLWSVVAQGQFNRMGAQKEGDAAIDKLRKEANKSDKDIKRDREMDAPAPKQIEDAMREAGKGAGKSLYDAMFDFSEDDTGDGQPAAPNWQTSKDGYNTGPAANDMQDAATGLAAAGQSLLEAGKLFLDYIGKLGPPV